MCPNLPVPANARVNFSADGVAPFTLGTIATYSCNQGFGLNGNAVRTCSEIVDITNPQADWSGNPPSCEGLFSLRVYSLSCL